MDNNMGLSLPEIQQEALSVLEKFANLCDEHNWTYFLAYGTLLGAIRHEGFIPWDDDVDVFMPRKDFDLFIIWCEKNENEIYPFKLCTRKTVKNYPFGIPRFANMNFKYLTLQKNHNDFDIGVFIDVYPLDNYCSSYDDGLKLTRRVEKLTNKVPIYLCGKAKKNGIIWSMLKQMYHFLLFITKPRNYPALIDEKIKNIIKQKTTENDLFVGCPSWPNGTCRQFNREWFRTRELHLFAGKKFYIPSGYEEFLRYFYGDYMQPPPEDKRNPYHGYKIIKR